MAMNKMGPLINLWSMRFEAKHYITKRLAGVAGCFKDFCMTAASRHQVTHCSKWSEHGQRSHKLEVKEACPCLVADLDNFPALLNESSGASSYR